MSASTSVPRPRAIARTAARVWDYVELTKPKISVLVLASVAVAGFVSRWGQPNIGLLLSTLLGVFFTAASASAFNQILERRKDALMPRTENRPLPAGRISMSQAVLFGAVMITAGVLYLGLMVSWTSAAWAFITWFAYVWVYTPLKYRTWLNTLVGAIAGALPIFIGWTGAGGAIDARAWSVFLLVFFWQFPHFMAIAWIYRKQYGQAGMKMLPVVEPTGRLAGAHAVICAVLVLPISFVPALMTPNPQWFVITAFILGVLQFACAVRFAFALNDGAARLLLRASLVYLPAMLMLLVLLQYR